MDRFLRNQPGLRSQAGLGPLLFIIYASPLFLNLKSHLPSVQTYTEDTQLYISINPADNYSDAQRL